ncbi:MAG: biopolymer transporter ExbD [Spirochaetales bacterium]|nr:biopolymer transporter ExbD [Spirochaetales bacterium]
MEFKRRLSPRAYVDLVPMIDVVFQLVIFFMLSSTFIQTPGISLILPESKTAEPVVMTRLVVTVVSGEEVYLNKEPYDLAGLRQALGKLTDEEKERIDTAVIEGDQAVSYSLMVEVLDILRSNGFKAVNLKTTEVRGP